MEFITLTVPTGAILVEVTLPEGIEYAGELKLKGSAATKMQIAHVTAGSTPSKPKFEITPKSGQNFAAGDIVTFSFKKTANCTAYTNFKGGLELKDKVKVTFDGTETTAETATYNLDYPELVLNTPTEQSDVVPFTEVTRELSFTNGSLVPARKVYLEINYGSDLYFKGAGKAILEVKKGSNYTALTPVETDGGKVVYELTGATFGGDNKLTNGEQIILRETFKQKTQNLVANYTLGYGCDLDNICEPMTGSASITNKIGEAELTQNEVEKFDVTSACAPFKMKGTYTNGADATTPEKKVMNAMLNVKVWWGAYHYNSPYYFFTFNNFKVGNSGVLTTPTERTGQFALDNQESLKTDPDGAGVGLEDVDGDGYFDDLPAGNTFVIQGDVQYEQPPGEMTVKTGYYRDATFKTRVSWKSKGIEIFSDTQNLGNGLLSARFARYEPRANEVLNITNGVPFDFGIGMNIYDFSFVFYDNVKGRVITEYEFPAGTVIDKTKIKWSNSKHIQGALVDVPLANITLSPDGTKLKVVAPNAKIGAVVIKDMVYNCTASDGFTYKMKWYTVPNYIDYPDCTSTVKPEIKTTGTLNVIGCSTCTQGAEITSAKAEREDNSLGWKSYTMTEKQDRSAIPKKELARVLYGDEFFIETTGVQHGTATNLGARFVLIKDNKGKNSIEPLSADIRVERAGAEVLNKTDITVATSDNSTAKDQIIDWDLTTAVTELGGLQDGDKLFVTMHYKSISNDTDRKTQNSAKELYLYNSNATTNPVWTGVEEKCNAYTPYLSVESYRQVVANGNIKLFTGNNTVHAGPQGTQYFTTYNGDIFDAYGDGGRKFAYEYRPSTKFGKITITVKPDFHVEEFTFRNVTSTKPLKPLEILSQEKQPNGDIVYECKLPEDERTIAIYPLGYGLRIFVKGTFTCSAKEGKSRNFYIAMESEEFYYLKDHSDYTPYIRDRKGHVDYTFDNKPSVDFIDETGLVELTQTEGEWRIKMSNSSASNAPYTWLAFPTNKDIEIKKVIRMSDGDEMTAEAYTTGEGGKMYKLSEAGIASGASETYKIKFAYKPNSTTCDQVNYDVLGGWNTTGFPATPEEYICNKNAVTLSTRALPTGLETLEVTVPDPTQKYPLCEDLEYEYKMQATAKGTVLNPKFLVIPSDGMEVKDVEAEYPSGAGNWQSVTTKLVNGIYQSDLTTHPDIEYLKGLQEAGSNNEQRQINVRFKINTGCGFASGSNFKINGQGYSSCNKLVRGAEIEVSTPSINLQGVVYNYTSINEVTSTADFATPACEEEKLIKVKQTIVGGTTGPDGRVEITIPEGYKYVPNSYEKINSKAPAGATAEDLATGAQVLKLSIPQGINNTGEMLYSFKIKEDKTKSHCGKFVIDLISYDFGGTMTCGTEVCNNLKKVTGKDKYEFTVTKSEPEVTIVSATSEYAAGAENIMLNYSVKNNGTVGLAAGTVLTLFDDKNENGVRDADENIVGTHNLSKAVAAGATVEESFSVNGATPKELCHLALTILPADGCFCSVVAGSVKISEVAGLAGEDKSFVITETKQIGVAPSASYENIKWTSNNSEATSYLSSTTVSNPEFHYTGTDLLSDKEYEFTVTATRKGGGCTVTDKVTVRATVIKVTGVTLNKTKITKAGGETEKLVATVKPSNATVKDVIWTSNNATVATVDATGKVTTKKPGKAIITATTKDGSKKATCTVTVVAPTAPTIVKLINAKDPITGTAEPGATVVITLPGNVKKTVKANSSGKWSLTNPKNLKTGQKVKAHTVDKAGNKSKAVTARLIL